MRGLEGTALGYHLLSRVSNPISAGSVTFSLASKEIMFSVSEIGGLGVSMGVVYPLKR
jgi:hypothetical protein